MGSAGKDGGTGVASNNQSMINNRRTEGDVKNKCLVYIRHFKQFRVAIIAAIYYPCNTAVGLRSVLWLLCLLDKVAAQIIDEMVKSSAP